MKCRDMLQSGRLEKQNLETAGRKSENRREKQIRGMENLLQDKSAGDELDILAAVPAMGYMIFRKKLFPARLP